MAAGGLPPAVIDARNRLAEGRVKLRAQHDRGSQGTQVCARLADLMDSIILDLYQAAWDDLDQAALVGNVSLVAHGGYGRRDVAPYSDVDLMLLHAPSIAQPVLPLAKSLSQSIVDAGCELGFSLRTIPQALKSAWTDPRIFSSLAESRLVAGSLDLFSQYMHGLRQGAKRRSRRLMGALEQARFEERRKFGETVFLLEPNIKRSRGGLRDIQLVRWVGFANHGECDLERLMHLGHLTQEDHRTLREGYQYLLRLRNQMHFEAGKRQDQLDRALQMRLAEWHGFKGGEGILPVEQFMQEYFAQTSEIRYSSAQFVDTARFPPPIVQTLARSLAIPIHRDFRMGWRTIWATDAGLERLTRDPAAVLELMSISSRSGKSIEHQTWREIRSAMLSRQTREIDSTTIQRFMELMGQTKGLGTQLRRIHELRVLEQIIPDMAHAHCLLQFNQYHKYTVDAHCIRAVECVTELEGERSTLGDIYHRLSKKTILHLALLLHDLGKGFPEDHSEVGKRIAARTADRLRLSPEDKDLLMFLVHKHLLLSHTAFRFDLSDLAATVKFASVVGSSERLRMLLLLSYADLASVGPDVVNQWKIDLLLQLYYQTDSHFRDEKPGEHFRAEIQRRRAAILDLVSNEEDRAWWERQVGGLDVGYLLRCSPEVAVQEVGRLKELHSKPTISWGRYVASQNAMEYTVVTKQSGRSLGTFHRITGALSSQGMQIISADIHSQPDNIAWDRFLVEDKEYAEQPPQDRVDAVLQEIHVALSSPDYAPVFPTLRGPEHRQTPTDFQIQPTQVRFDNSTSEQFTIITLFAYDRLGLLYTVAKILFELDLILHSAKISTHLDQVVDVFYVSDIQGEKIEESFRLYLIRQRLLQAIGGHAD